MAATTKHRLSVDFETRSTIDLRRCGVYRYAEDPTTDILCMAWAFDDEDPNIWVPGEPIPAAVSAHVQSGGEMRAWNAEFERLLWRYVLGPRYGAPVPTVEQWYDTAAEAAAMGLPRGLDAAAKATGVSQQKDAAGHRLMLRMSQPRSVSEDGTVTWWDDQKRLDQLFAYCKQDVRTEQAMYAVTVRLSPDERRVFLLDQAMHDRGIHLDTSLVRGGIEIAAEASRRAAEELTRLTGGEVQSVQQSAKLVTWLRSRGCDVTSVDRASVRDLLNGSVDDVTARVLSVRADASRTSVAKLNSMQSAVCADGQLRGLTVYCGAHTGRWAGKLVQPQNFPRGEVPNIEACLPAIARADYEAVSCIAPPLTVVSSALRSMLTAREGHHLIAGDYSAIEARVLNWLAGQQDVLALFAAGQDVYKHNAARLYGIPLDEVQKFPHRHTGKFQELACGFGMGAVSAVTKAHDIYELELTPEFAQQIVDDYRQSHHAVREFWNATQDAFITSVQERAPVRFGHNGLLVVDTQGAYTGVTLPSGRILYYPSPRVVQRETPWGAVQAAFSYVGVCQATHQWARDTTYGAALVENIVQAVARDILAYAMLRLDNAGYPPILCVHDEIVVEVPAGNMDAQVAEVTRLMEAPEAWTRGCPLSVEAWAGPRYRK